MTDEMKIPDEFQQLKGTIGQEIAKLYLERIEEYEIIGEELEVIGLPRAGLDILVRKNKRYRPVEVKFQKAQIKSYGKPFECILTKLNEGVEIFARKKGGLQKHLLEDPILFIWEPPAGSIKSGFIKDCYNKLELFQFGDVITCLQRKLGNDEYINLIIHRICEKIKKFLVKNNCQISHEQRKHLKSFFPNWSGEINQAKRR